MKITEILTAEFLINEFLFVLKGLEKIKLMTQKQWAKFKDLKSKYINAKIMLDGMETNVLFNTSENQVYFKIGKELSKKIVEKIDLTQNLYL